MGLFSSLNKEQREAVVLLQTGTFLEYFDLMLYVHMAVLLNELFFPKTDPHTASLLAALAFCSTFVMRPFGALLFGYIGDNVGRKTTVIITTTMMAISCIMMANLPTYAQVGIAASWAVTLCRMVQGMSSMGEIIGAQIYLTEITRPPMRYPVVSLLSVSDALGSVSALALAYIVTSYEFNWRFAFWGGAIIALVGTLARTRLRETPDFVDMKRRIKKTVEEAEEGGLDRAAELLKKTSIVWKEKINKKTTLAYFFILCGWPIFFYFSYIHCGHILRNQFGYSSNDIIQHNFYVSLFQLASWILATMACKWLNPLTILRMRTYAITVVVLFLPLALSHLTSSVELFVCQSLGVFFGLIDIPAIPIILIHFPIFRRFTCATLSYALSRALVYIITSFGLIYLTGFFGHYGLWGIMIPVIAGFYWGVRHFEKLETLTGSDEKRDQNIPFINPSEKIKAIS